MAEPDPVVLWERLAGAHPAAQGATLLETLGVDPGAVPLGLGLRHMLDLRAALIGASVDGYAECPQCGDPISAPLLHADLDGAVVPADAAALQLQWQDFTFDLRPPTPADLAAAGALNSIAAATEYLQRAVLLGAKRGGDTVPAEQVPQDAWDAIDAALEQADELADPVIALHCQSCAAQWDLSLDLPGLMFRELEHLAKTRLADIAELARSYGWSEAEVLALSPARRRIYLDLARESSGGLA